jgi:outer membrane protein
MPFFLFSVQARRFAVVGIVLARLIFGEVPPLGAQPPNLPPSPLTIAQAIQFGIDHYPSVRASLARVYAAKAGVDLTRTAYLPRVEMGYQGNISSFNKVNGLFLQTPYVAPIWGPQRPEISFAGAWGSAAGALAAWEPFDFGLRAANVETARAVERQQAAGVALTKLDVAMGVGDAFLALVMAERTAEAMKGNVERRRVFAETAAVLVKSGLRPGVDASRAQAELAMARTQLIQAEQAQDIGRATLAEVLGVAGEYLVVADRELLTLPPATSVLEPAPWAHPLAIAQKATADVFTKRAEALDRAWVPRVDVVSLFFGRGSGWDPQGNRESGGLGNFDGLLPDVPNYASGIMLSFSLMDIIALRARQATERQNALAELAGYDQVIQTLTAKHAKAQATVQGARKVADNTRFSLPRLAKPKLRLGPATRLVSRRLWKSLTRNNW